MLPVQEVFEGGAMKHYFLLTVTLMHYEKRRYISAAALQYRLCFLEIFTCRDMKP